MKEHNLIFHSIQPMYVIAHPECVVKWGCYMYVAKLCEFEGQ